MQTTHCNGHNSGCSEKIMHHILNLCIVLLQNIAIFIINLHNNSKLRTNLLNFKAVLGYTVSNQLIFIPVTAFSIGIHT